MIKGGGLLRLHVSRAIMLIFVKHFRGTWRSTRNDLIPCKWNKLN